LKQNLQASRISLRLCRLALLSAMGLTTAVRPLHVMALQVPEPPAQPYVESPAEEAKHPPHTPAQKAEEHENDEYRHAAVVQSLARWLHMDVETAARTFEFFNVGVVVLGIVIPLVRIMPRLMRGRSQKIQANIDAARKTTEDANRRLSAVEAKLAGLDEEIAKFRFEMEQQIVQDEQRGKAAIEEESARIVASAEQEISLAAAQAKRSLRHFAADLAIEQAARQLVLTPDTDRALIAEFVRETGRDGANRGGKN
jgi:F-type H+-transporting ATPase subunit b